MRHAGTTGSIAMLGRRLFSAQLEDSCFVLLAESDDVVAMAPQKVRDVVGGTVAELNPGELRGAPRKTASR
jgi:hypothetical protein